MRDGPANKSFAAAERDDSANERVCLIAILGRLKRWSVSAGSRSAKLRVVWAWAFSRPGTCSDRESNEDRELQKGLEKACSCSFLCGYCTMIIGMPHG